MLLVVALSAGIVSGAILLLGVGVCTWNCLKKRRDNDVGSPDEEQSPYSQDDSPDTFPDPNVTISQSVPDFLQTARKGSAASVNGNNGVNRTRLASITSLQQSEEKIGRRHYKTVVKQTTLPSEPQRHLSFKRQLFHKFDLSNVEFAVHSMTYKEQPHYGTIKPELYHSQESPSNQNSEGQLYFTLYYDQDVGLLHVSILNAKGLPAKDFSGSSDPYVKLLLLPDRKKKHTTKVHRKTLNPVFNESFVFPVQSQELAERYLQFTVYDFDRFSRHDLIGVVVIKDLHNLSLNETQSFSRDIISAGQEKSELGELMLSLCYLPTAGRLTVTIIKARDLRAMDITGSSDPYVKICLVCRGKRIKKKKTSTKKATVNPVYNEAIVFDVPQENVEEVCLSIKVLDYDRVGSNEVMGSCGAGLRYLGTGRQHWIEMLESPRKPIAQWYTLQEQDTIQDSPAHSRTNKRKSIF